MSLKFVKIFKMFQIKSFTRVIVSINTYFVLLVIWGRNGGILSKCPNNASNKEIY